MFWPYIAVGSNSKIVVKSAHSTSQHAVPFVLLHIALILQVLDGSLSAPNEARKHNWRDETETRFASISEHLNPQFSIRLTSPGPSVDKTQDWRLSFFALWSQKLVRLRPDP